MADVDIPPPDNTLSPWMQPWFLISAVVLIALVACGLFVLIPRDSESTAATPAPRAATQQVAETGPAASACGLPAGDQTIPTTTPPDTKWELVNTLAAPTAPKTIGPGRIDDGVRTCFARSPLGALYASVNVLAAFGATGEAAVPAAKALTTPEAGRDRVVRELQKDGATGNTTRLQVSGYQFLNYTPERATVDLALRVDAKGEVHMALEMVWNNGDWKLVIPPTGTPFDNSGPLPNTSGYVQWSGA